MQKRPPRARRRRPSPSSSRTSGAPPQRVRGVRVAVHHAAAAAEQAARRVRGARVVVPLPAAAERPASPRRVGGARVVVPPPAAAAGRPPPPRRPLTSPPFAAAVRCLFSLCRRRLFTSLSNCYLCTLLFSCRLPPPLLRPTQVPLPGLAVHAPGATDRRECECSAGCGDGGKCAGWHVLPPCRRNCPAPCANHGANTPQHPHPQRARVRARATAAGGPRPRRDLEQGP